MAGGYRQPLSECQSARRQASAPGTDEPLRRRHPNPPRPRRLDREAAAGAREGSGGGRGGRIARAVISGDSNRHEPVLCFSPRAQKSPTVSPPSRVKSA